MSIEPQRVHPHTQTHNTLTNTTLTHTCQSVKTKLFPLIIVAISFLSARYIAYVSVFNLEINIEYHYTHTTLYVYVCVWLHTMLTKSKLYITPRTKNKRTL